MSHLLGALSGIDPAPQRVLMASAGLAGLTLVFDEHVEMRLFRQLSSGPHPEVELTLALDGAGFNHLPAPLAVWRRGGCDLGLVREHLHAASDGWALASTSLRDLYAAGLPAGYAGGDFAPEASRIGEMTARMHIALAEAFGVVSPTPAPERSPRGSSGSLLSAAEIRIHGSYSLRAIVRSEVGWFVRDFVSEAGPVPSADWARHSPLWDLVTMVGSFNDAARATALERQPLEPDALADLALSWVRRNQQALTDAYLQTAGIEKLVMDPQAFVLELDHLLYPKIHR
ncbi:MAG: hypothetical protein M1115_11000 [Actinobacteria bacterium]|nr:hypothetical protein [Actinomycetota bacterium]